MALREIIAHFGFDFDGAKADDADKRVKSIKNNAEQSAHGIGVLVDAWRALVGVEIGRQVYEWVDSLTEQADAVGDVSEAVGLSTRELQVWQFGAAKAGEGSEVFTAALRKLSAAAAGGVDETGSASKIFDKLKIKTKDATGTVRGLGELLPEIAEHFHEMKDGAAKAALSQELFGRGGTKLIPLLNQGADGIARLREEFDELGGGFSPEAIEKAGQMKDAIARTTYAFNGLKSEVALQLLPKFADFLETTTGLVVKFRDFAEDTTILNGAVGSLATTIGVTMWGALSPFLFGALKFAAVYLAVDDLKGFLEGQDSEIGRILDGWFGDGTADKARMWVEDAISAAGDLKDDLVALMPLIGAAWDITIAGMSLGWHSFIQETENAWNAFVDTVLGEGGNSKLQFDMTAVSDRVASASLAKKEATARALAAQRNVGQYARSTEVAANNIASTPGPVMAPSTKSTWNTIENKQTFNIMVPAGTTDATTRAIAREVRTIQRDQHRAALQDLEARK